MTDSACAKQSGKIAKTHLGSLFAADAMGALDAHYALGTGWSSLATLLAVAAPTTHEDRRLARPIEARSRRTARHLTYVLPARTFPDDLGTTARRRDGVNGAALQFRPGGT
ncbi:MAG TPA: hypothetical protein VH519_08385 [Hyphomicrobiaceae bacterium]|jgi:peptide methionine sulfoxide reductase MsrB